MLHGEGHVRPHRPRGYGESYSPQTTRLRGKVTLVPCVATRRRGKVMLVPANHEAAGKVTLVPTGHEAVGKATLVPAGHVVVGKGQARSCRHTWLQGRSRPSPQTIGQRAKATLAPAYCAGVGKVSLSRQARPCRPGRCKTGRFNKIAGDVLARPCRL